MITLLTVLGIFVSIVIMAALSATILTFGKIIAKTPDMKDRYGERQGPTDAPVRHARLFVEGFVSVFMVGMVVVLFTEDVRIAVIGSVIMFASLLFAGTIALMSMKVYGLMKENAREHKGTMKCRT
jgi:hypothetical protein